MNKKLGFKTRLLHKLAFLTGKYFSLDKCFRKRRAVARIRFTKTDKLGGSIVLSVGGMNYYFEGTPEIRKYKGSTGGDVFEKTLKYGGWELDMTHEDNKIPILNPSSKKV